MFVSQIMLIQSHLRHFQYYVEEALARWNDPRNTWTTFFYQYEPKYWNSWQSVEISLRCLSFQFCCFKCPKRGQSIIVFFVFCSLSFFSGVYGIVIANADIKYHTMKIRRCLDSQWQINRHKIGAGFLSLTIFILASLSLFLTLQSFSRFLFRLTNRHKSMKR